MPAQGDKETQAGSRESGQLDSWTGCSNGSDAGSAADDGSEGSQPRL
jgi:hypothetical protein